MFPLANEKMICIRRDEQCNPQCTTSEQHVRSIQLYGINISIQCAWYIGFNLSVFATVTTIMANDNDFVSRMSDAPISILMLLLASLLLVAMPGARSSVLAPSLRFSQDIKKAPTEDVCWVTVGQSHVASVFQQRELGVCPRRRFVCFAWLVAKQILEVAEQVLKRLRSREEGSKFPEQAREEISSKVAPGKRGFWNSRGGARACSRLRR